VKQTFVVPHGVRALYDALDRLDSSKKWRVTIEPYKSKRTLEQNNFLHAVPLKILCDHTGYDVDDMKHWLCGKAFGWEEYEMMGEKRKKPRLTTSQLNTEQFAWFIEWVIQWAAQELGLQIPLPNEEM
jgi:hypothetical protein